jgi:hypothetical protein
VVAIGPDAEKRVRDFVRKKEREGRSVLGLLQR